MKLPLKLSIVAMTAVLVAGCGSAKVTPAEIKVMPATPAPAPAPAVIGDADGDGVLDNVDECPDTRAGAKVDARGCEIILSFSGTNFAFDSAAFSSTAISNLNSAVAQLKAHGGSNLEIGGHTDSVGSEEYNQGLGQHRAQAVYNYLVQNGIPADSMTVRSFGESRPVATNDTDAGRAANRRVEIVDVTGQ